MASTFAFVVLVYENWVVVLTYFSKIGLKPSKKGQLQIETLTEEVFSRNSEGNVLFSKWLISYGKVHAIKLVVPAGMWI